MMNYNNMPSDGKYSDLNSERLFLPVFDKSLQITISLLKLFTCKSSRNTCIRKKEFYYRIFEEINEILRVINIYVFREEI